VVLRILIDGAVGGAVLSAFAFCLSRFWKDLAGRVLLATALILAAVFYVLFALRGAAGPAWTVVELVGIAAYATMGLMGLRRSPMWLAAGWALHPLWDLVLHYFGPGHSFAPENYTIACLSFDLVVAAYVVVAYRLGLVGDRKPALAPRAKTA
jgi:hypothetical protein